MTARWKKNSFRKLPRNLEQQLSEINSPLVQVAVVKQVSVSDLAASKYEHIGISGNPIIQMISSEIVPDKSIGLFSKRNQEGWEKVRKDLPMVDRTWTTEHENFGDGSTYGYRTQEHTRPTYQKEFFEAPMLSITSEVLSSPNDHVDIYRVKFSVDQLIDREEPKFDENLLFAVNLMQENVGASALFSSNASRADFIKDKNLAWEIFPQGTAEQVVHSLGNKGIRLTDEEKKVVEERTNLFRDLGCSAYIAGSNSMNHYFGAVIADDLVVFENLKYGNALYILFEDWKTVSQMSRSEILRGTDDNYRRIVHRSGWKRRLKLAINDELRARGLPLR